MVEVLHIGEPIRDMLADDLYILGVAAGSSIVLHVLCVIDFDDGLVGIVAVMVHFHFVRL